MNASSSDPGSPSSIELGGRSDDRSGVIRWTDGKRSRSFVADHVSASRAVARPSNGAALRPTPEHRHDPSADAVLLRTVREPLIRYADLVISVDEMDTAERLTLLVGADERQSARPGASALTQVNNMAIHMTRSRLIQIWFAGVALVVVAALALRAALTVSTGAMLLALALAPALLVLLLWPGVQPPTASEVIHGTDRRR